MTRDDDLLEEAQAMDPVSARAPETAAAIETAIEASACDAGFTLDPGQRALAGRLAVLAAELAAAHSIEDSGTVRGMYVWGPAGRGKSWLVDAFFDALPLQRKRRVHFHAFFTELHARIFANRGTVGVFENAVGDLIGDARFLLFDEFHVHDPGHATLLTGLLRYALEHRITVVATSNYPPQGLLPNPVYHHIFEPGISLIEQELDVVELPGDVDYRRSDAKGRERRGFATGTWTRVAPGASVPDRPAPDEATTLELGGRTFTVSAVRGRELWATFADLFVVQTSSLEYLRWARDYETWHVLDVPVLASVGREPQQRFVNAVDVLVDYDVETHFHAAATFDEFVSAAAGRADAFRMISRLHLLQR